jgi:hypothetical protein
MPQIQAKTGRARTTRQPKGSPMATKTAGRTVTFSDGSAADFDAVVSA